MNERLLTPLADYSRQALQVGTPPLYLFDDNERPANKELIALSLQLRQVEAQERQAAIADAAYAKKVQQSNTGHLSKTGRELHLSFTATSLAMGDTLFEQLTQVLRTLERLSGVEAWQQARNDDDRELQAVYCTLAQLTETGEVAAGIAMSAEQAEDTWAYLQGKRDELVARVAGLDQLLRDYEAPAGPAPTQEWAVPLSAYDEAGYRVIAGEYNERHGSFPERRIELVGYQAGQGFHLRFASAQALYFWGRQWGEAKGSGRVAAMREGRDTTPYERGGPRLG